MPIKVSKYDINVKERALELGCNVPTGLALLPRNFETAKSKDELEYEGDVDTIRTLWRNAHIEETRIEKEGDKFPYIQYKSFWMWVSPTIFISASLLSQNPYLITLALNVIANYLTDFFKGSVGLKEVKLHFLKENVRGDNIELQRIEFDYTGPNDGIKHEFKKLIKELTRQP